MSPYASVRGLISTGNAFLTKSTKKQFIAVELGESRAKTSMCLMKRQRDVTDERRYLLNFPRHQRLRAQMNVTFMEREMLYNFARERRVSFRPQAITTTKLFLSEIFKRAPHDKAN